MTNKREIEMQNEGNSFYAEIQICIYITCTFYLQANSKNEVKAIEVIEIMLQRWIAKMFTHFLTCSLWYNFDVF